MSRFRLTASSIFEAKTSDAMANICEQNQKWNLVEPYGTETDTLNEPDENSNLHWVIDKRFEVVKPLKQNLSSGHGNLKHHFLLPSIKRSDICQSLDIPEVIWEEFRLFESIHNL